jgi:hypothetical protein
MLLRALLLAPALLAWIATASAQITPGVATITSIGVTQIGVAASLQSGGGGSFSYQWYRDPSPGTPTHALSGQTAGTLMDTTASANTDYYYAMSYHDTQGDPTVHTAQVHVKTLPASALEIVGGIGDSIMAGACSGAAPLQNAFQFMVSSLNAQANGKHQFVIPANGNRAHSGWTSTDWADTSFGSYMRGTVGLFSAANVTLIVI